MVNNPFSGARAALFDLDGTLIRTHIDFPAMKFRIADLVEQFISLPDNLLEYDIMGLVYQVETRLLTMGKGPLAKEFREEAFALLEEIEKQQCATPEEFPGATDLLKELHKRDVKVGVVTRNCRVVASQLLTAGNLRTDTLVCRDDVNHVKPDPEQIHFALKAMGFPLDLPADQIVVIGDHPMDIEAGKAAGARTIGVLHGQPTSIFDESKPDLIVPVIGDLVSLVKAL